VKALVLFRNATSSSNLQISTQISIQNTNLRKNQNNQIIFKTIRKLCLHRYSDLIIEQSVKIVIFWIIF